MRKCKSGIRNLMRTGRYVGLFLRVRLQLKLYNRNEHSKKLVVFCKIRQNSISLIYVSWFLNYCTCTGRHRKTDRYRERERERETKTDRHRCFEGHRCFNMRPIGKGTCVKIRVKYESHTHTHTHTCIQELIVLSIKVNVKHSRNRPCRPRGVQEVTAPRFLDNGTVWWQIVRLTHRPPLPPGIFLVLIFTTG